MTVPRPKILCIRPRPNPDCATVLHGVVDEWVATLALHAEVETIDHDFDLAEVAARVQPDLLLFDSIHWGRPHRLAIAHADACPEVPRALFLNSDPHDPMRPLTMAMVGAYGIDTIFCMGTEDLAQMNELRWATCFILPKFVDAAVFRDHGGERPIPVTIISGHLFPAFYPWRAQVTEEIQRVIPTLVYPHPGYAKGAHNPFEIRDEAYARMLSRSQFCITDTTRLDYVVRKHVEIPAAGSVLVSPPSQALADYGFVDMENCILGAAGPELYSRIVRVASDPQLYERIRASGHRLVHERYTRAQWTHILDWLACRQALKPGESVQQQGVFGRFAAVPAGAGAVSVAGLEVHDNPMAERLRAARVALLHDGDLIAAANGLRECMGWVGHVAEPWFMMGVIAMAVGNHADAAEWLGQRARVQGGQGAGLGLFDPCEIAWLLLLAYCTDDEALFRQMAEAANATSHLSIRRMAWLIDGAPEVADLAEAGLAHPLPGDAPSIHWLGDEDLDDWFSLMQRVLARMPAAEAA